MGLEPTKVKMKKKTNRTFEGTSATGNFHEALAAALAQLRLALNEGNAIDAKAQWKLGKIEGQLEEKEGLESITVRIKAKRSPAWLEHTISYS